MVSIIKNSADINIYIYLYPFTINIQQSLFFFSHILGIHKRDLTLEKQILRNIMLYSECPPFPFSTQIINPFLNLMISANHNAVEEIQPIQW